MSSSAEKWLSIAMGYEYLTTAGVVDRDEEGIKCNEYYLVDATLEWKSRVTFPTIARVVREDDRHVN